MCTPFNDCYLRNQVFYFDHCWLVDIVDHPIRVKVIIYNHAGLRTDTEINVKPHLSLYIYSNSNMSENPVVYCLMLSVQYAILRFKISYDLAHLCYNSFY